MNTLTTHKAPWSILAAALVRLSLVSFHIADLPHPDDPHPLEERFADNGTYPIPLADASSSEVYPRYARTLAMAMLADAQRPLHLQIVLGGIGTAAWIFGQQPIPAARLGSQERTA